MTTVISEPTGTLFPVGVITQYHVRKAMKTTKEFKNFNAAWDKSTLGWWQGIGHCMLTARTHRPKTFAEWVEVYFTYCKDWNEIQALGGRWAAITGLPLQTAIAHVIIHAIDETWDGFKGELEAEQLMRDYHSLFGEEVIEATDDEDFNFSIDFVIKSGDAIVQAVQVKPAGYFYSDRIQKERDRYKRANAKFTAATGAPVYYVNLADVREGRLNYIPLSDIK